MSKRTKKVGITGKYGTRYGGALRKIARKYEVSAHAKYICGFCGKVKLTRKDSSDKQSGSGSVNIAERVSLEEPGCLPLEMLRTSSQLSFD